MLRQGRDSTRMREIGTLHRAISMLRIDTPAAPLGSSNTIHVSIPSDSPTCANLGLPTPPPGWVYRCVSAANLRNIDNTGWIPIDFTVMPRGSPLASLPIDPVNTVASSNFYVFVTDGRTWTLASLMESERHAPSAARDGGTDAARFEAGTNLSLWTSASGLVGYWSFDGTGSIAHNQTAGLRDTSGRGNHGTASNANAVGMAFVPGRVGNAVTFDGVDDFVDAGTHASLRPRDLTVEFWLRPSGWLDLNTGWASHHIFYMGDGYGVQTNGINWVWWVRTAAGRQIRSLAHQNQLNIWHHLILTYDTSSGNMKFYWNGVLQDTHSLGAGTLINYAGASWGWLAIGHGGDLTTNGLIDEVRIHNRALTEAEIRTIFNATR